MDADRFLGVVEDEGRALLSLAEGADLALPVEACPDWTVADLVAHVVRVYRWAALVVGEARTQRPAREERAGLEVADREREPLLAAFAGAHRRIVDVLRGAPDDLECWTMWPATSSRHYWIRRQAHETLIHRVDVAGAVSGERPPADVAPEIAADGVAELLLGFVPLVRPRAAVPLSIRLHATDVDRSWWLRFGPDGVESGRGVVDGAGTDVRGRAGELLLLLWNRRDWSGLEVAGSAEPLRAWREAARV
jgi:uncharacterized protein (TIGR03083 family)